MANAASTKKKKMVIDCDCGLDDAQAIMLALGMKKEVDVLAITCVAGNTSVEQAAKNVVKVLEVCHSLGQVPVYIGCDKSLLGERGECSFYHGKDGLGDVSAELVTPVPNAHEYISDTHATQALISLANEHQNEITLIAIGPLTNIAMACRLDDKFGDKLKECYIMGGNYKGVGNITCAAEYNFHTDPEAAHITLRELTCPITLIPWELCKDNPVDMSWYEHEFLAARSARSEFVRHIDTHGIRSLADTDIPYVWCDQFAVLSALRPLQVITDSQSSRCAVELRGRGDESRGQCVIDWPSFAPLDSHRSGVVRIVTGVDTTLCHRLMLNCV